MITSCVFWYTTITHILLNLEDILKHLKMKLRLVEVIYFFLNGWCRLNKVICQSFHQLATAHWQYTVYVTGQCLRKEAWHHLSVCCTLFEMNKWIILLMWLQYLFNLLALENYICSPAEREKLHFERKQNLPLPGTLCSLLCSEVLTDRNMKSGRGPTEALLLQAQTEPAAGSYWASYIMSPSLLMKISSSHHAMLHIKLLISNSDNTCRNAPLLCHCPVEQFYRANINTHTWFWCIVLFPICTPVCSLALKPFLNLCIQFQHHNSEVLLKPFPYLLYVTANLFQDVRLETHFPYSSFSSPFFCI